MCSEIRLRRICLSIQDGKKSVNTEIKPESELSVFSTAIIAVSPDKENKNPGSLEKEISDKLDRLRGTSIPLLGATVKVRSEDTKVFLSTFP